MSAAEMVDWYLAVLDEIERVAARTFAETVIETAGPVDHATGLPTFVRSETHARWSAGYDEISEFLAFVEAPGLNVRIATRGTGIPASAAADHIAENSPVTVLADIAAKRAIVGIHERSDCQGHAGPWIPHGNACTFQCTGCCGDTFPCLTLRHLAAAESHRPGYQERWRP